MNNRHSSEGFYAYANGFQLAAQILIERQVPGVAVPTVYLLTHALELALKSFLLFNGVDGKILAKLPYGHDIKRCLNEAEKTGAFTALTDEQRKAISIASAMFEKKELNYLYEDMAFARAFPNVKELQHGLQTVMAVVFNSVSSPYYHDTKR